MSVFAIAIATLLNHEGLYSNDVHDKGGETAYGISLRYIKSESETNKSAMASFDFNNDGEIDGKDIRSLSKSDAIKIYREFWWDKYGFGRINSQKIATKVFDLAINMGKKQAIIALQRAVRAVTENKMADDGDLGPITLAVVNSVDPDLLYVALKSEAAGIYRSIGSKRYINGWLNRAYS